VAGYPVGGDFEIKYYMLQMHFNNAHQVSSKIFELIVIKEE
jgi:hypothetical protein